MKKSAKSNYRSKDVIQHPTLGEIDLTKDLQLLTTAENLALMLMPDFTKDDEANALVHTATHLGMAPEYAKFLAKEGFVEEAELVRHGMTDGTPAQLQDEIDDKTSRLRFAFAWMFQAGRLAEVHKFPNITSAYLRSTHPGQ
jgi:hypothetical protein